MTKNKQTWVSPNQGDWKVHHPGSIRASAIVKIKAEAVEIARTISQNQKTELIVQNRTGKIGFKDSHGNDPSPPKN